MNQVTQALNEIDRSLEILRENIAQGKISQNCLQTLDEIRKSLNYARQKSVEHQQRDKLLDDLYHSVGSKLNSTFNLDELLGIILDSLQQLIGFNAAGIFLLNNLTGEIEAEYVKGYQEEYFQQIHQKVGEGVLGWVITNAKSANIPDVSQYKNYINARPQTKSELAVPMINEGKVIGCINLESNRINAFSPEDTIILETYSTQASLAVERARLQSQIWEKKRLEDELTLARNIQESLLPQKAPSVENFFLAGLNIPSSLVGGDYYDYIPLNTGGIGLAIADVAGKGLGAALIMSGFRAALRSEIRHNLQPHQVMHKANHFVFESTESGGFVTAFYGILIGRQFTYVNAGHNPPILLRNDDTMELLSEGGMLLGYDEEQYFNQGTVILQPGDSLLFYTDGVTEALNRKDQEFGVERLIQVLREAKNLPFNQQIKFIHQQVIDFTGNSKKLMDDLTLMILCCQ